MDPLEKWSHESVVGILALMVRDIQVKLDLIMVDIGKIRKEQRKMSAELESLRSEVAETSTVIDSAITLINGLAAKIVELKDDPAALAALASDLNAKSEELATAVTANTPAEEPAP